MDGGSFHKTVSVIAIRLQDRIYDIETKITVKHCLECYCCRQNQCL